MAVSGGYLTWRVRYAVAPIRAFAELIDVDMLPQFKDLSAKADAVADAEYERLGSAPADENWDGDMGALAEAAEDKGIEFYEIMSGLQYGMTGLFAAGLFHMVEQQLAYLCHDAAITAAALDDSKFKKIEHWYRKHFRLDLRTLPDWDTIDELRLVANTVKHAEGNAAEQLRKRQPKLFQGRLLREIDPAAPPPDRPLLQPLAGSDLFVEEDDLKRYFGAALHLFDSLASFFEENSNDYFG